MTSEHDERHLELLAQLAHTDHATPDGPVAWDRCDHPLCRTSQRVLADLRGTPMTSSESHLPTHRGRGPANIDCVDIAARRHDARVGEG